MLDPNGLRKGTIFKYRNSPARVVEFSHTHKGRGSATVTVKIRDLISNNVMTATFKPGDKLEQVDLNRRSADYLYQKKDMAYFMDNQTYEQISISKEKIKEQLNFLKEGASVTLVEFDGNPIEIDLPPKVELKVAETEPGVRGNTADGAAFKHAVLESGFTTEVPLFVKQNDIIRINTETGEYVERVS